MAPSTSRMLSFKKIISARNPRLPSISCVDRLEWQRTEIQATDKERSRQSTISTPIWLTNAAWLLSKRVVQMSWLSGQFRSVEIQARNEPVGCHSVDAFRRGDANSGASRGLCSWPCSLAQTRRDYSIEPGIGLQARQSPPVRR